MTLPHWFATPPRMFGSRREFLRVRGAGCGLLALAGLIESQGLLAATPEAARVNPMAPKPTHFPAKATSVIWLFMNGGPSQVDTWDYKPELEKRDGKDLEGFDKNTGFFTEQVGPLMKSPFKFTQRGQSGAWASEIFPQLGEHVDRMAFIHSCFTKTNNHSPALFEINTGMSRMGFPVHGSLGELWAGEREPQPARLRGDVRHAGARAAQGARAELGRGVPAGRVPGNGSQRARARRSTTCIGGQT